MQKASIFLGFAPWFNGVIPAVVLVGACKITEWYPDDAGKEDDPARVTSSPAGPA